MSSKVAAPVAKLARSINTAAVSTQQRHAGAALMPKYAELLRNRRSSEHTDSSRGLKTAHRPTPQPSIAGRPRPLMQSFSSGAAVSATPSTHLDATVLPNLAALDAAAATSAGPYVPFLPDNYSASHELEASDVVRSEPTIVAANPENIVPGAPMTGVEGLRIESVDLKFAHQQASPDADQSTFLSDLWKGMVDDVFGARKRTS